MNAKIIRVKDLGHFVSIQLDHTNASAKMASKKLRVQEIRVKVWLKVMKQIFKIGSLITYPYGKPYLQFETFSSMVQQQTGIKAS